jgi:hypothetical protein
MYTYTRKRRRLWLIVYGSLDNNGYCLYCNQKIKFQFSSLEHLLPRSCGGSNYVNDGNLFFNLHKM